MCRSRLPPLPTPLPLPPARPAPVPLERLEAQICELAGHLAAATCRFLVLLADFDARRGWASWEMRSCAAWLSWKCQMSSGAAREHVRVARALRDLPVIRGEFAAGRLSYAKMRALTRIATAETEAGLAEIAGPMTGNQLERFARAHRQASGADDAAAQIRRRLAWRFEEDGSLAGRFRLPPRAGAVLLTALRAAAAELGHPAGGPAGDQPADGDPGVSAETPAAGRPVLLRSSSLADALVQVAEAFLAGKVADADDAEVYQVIVHAGAGVLAPARAGAPDPDPASPAADPAAGRPAGVSAETPPPVPGIPALAPPVPGDPADPARCHVEDGPTISVPAAQMIACTATLSWMRHDRAGQVLALGRRRRRPNAAQRRAARERDRCRCRFPGCESRRADLHHIVHWIHGGRTDLDNLISVCPWHHKLIHDRGYLIAIQPDGGFAFYAPDGTALPNSPPLPPPDGPIGSAHSAEITPETIIPPWYGEKLDLDHALYICLANARNQQDRRDGRRREQEPEPFRPRLTPIEFSEAMEHIRQHYDQHPAARPGQQPIRSGA